MSNQKWNPFEILPLFLLLTFGGNNLEPWMRRLIDLVEDLNGSVQSMQQGMTVLDQGISQLMMPPGDNVSAPGQTEMHPKWETSSGSPGQWQENSSGHNDVVQDPGLPAEPADDLNNPADQNQNAPDMQNEAEKTDYAAQNNLPVSETHTKTETLSESIPSLLPVKSTGSNESETANPPGIKE